ncbi:Solute carrier organic anion transporter family member 1C1 [Lonchura striata]|uniref:Solute carrier organic anion transporter family member 1C1 n=1 Tax=Lonchura striata TaxID=40157 RepID=A0A218V925_9PASE|nr:Solute carrier organic anion transporter family member 1C1 [Lonchura striata domestica]
MASSSCPSGRLSPTWACPVVTAVVQHSWRAAVDGHKLVRREVVDRVPWEAVLGDEGVKEGWTLFKKEILKVQEQANGVMAEDTIMEISSKENTHFFSNNTVLLVDRSSFKSESSSSKEKQSCCGGIKIFLGALSFVYFAKALSGSYLKSTITQIERRFDIPSSLVGVIDGSFEIGNLLIIILVSYFGAKLHRPRIIGAGCLIMSAGTFLIAMPQFFMGRYSYERFPSTINSTVSLSPCLQDKGQTPLSALEKSQAKINAGENYLYAEDQVPFLAQECNNPLFSIPGCVQTVAIIGPIFGFLLGSLCAKLYVDIGFVDLDSVALSPKDVRWVGAWWLGYLIAGVISVLAGIPFWFLPKHLTQPESRKDSSTSSEHSKFIIEENKDQGASSWQQAKLAEMAKGKSLDIIQFNSLIGMVTYKPKYIEQQYGQTSSKTNFVIGLINIPAVAFGIFSGGLIMKRFGVGVLGAAKLSLGSSFLGYLLLLSLFAMGCENVEVAGLTVSYHGLVLPLTQALINHFSLRNVYLGLTLVLGTVSIFFSVAVLWVLRKRSSPQDETLSANGERGTRGTKSRKDNFFKSDQLIQSTYWPEKETRL